MGCVQTKAGGTYSPNRTIDRLKNQNGYVRGGEGRVGGGIERLKQQNGYLVKTGGKSAGNNGEEKKISREDEREGNGGKVSQRVVVKKIGTEELINGWPKWLVGNIPRDILANLVRKSADSYDKLGKVTQAIKVFS